MEKKLMFNYIKELLSSKEEDKNIGKNIDDNQREITKVKVYDEYTKKYYKVKDIIHYMDGKTEPIIYHTSTHPNNKTQAQCHEPGIINKGNIYPEIENGLKMYYIVTSINVEIYPHNRSIYPEKERVINVVINNVKKFESEVLEKNEFTDKYIKKVSEEYADRYERVYDT